MPWMVEHMTETGEVTPHVERETLLHDYSRPSYKEASQQVH
jgi:hypothetical protein